MSRKKICTFDRGILLHVHMDHLTDDTAIEFLFWTCVKCTHTCE